MVTRKRASTLNEEALKTIIAVTFVLSGTLAREIGNREATEFEVLCGLSVCRRAVEDILRNPKRHEAIVGKAIESIRSVVLDDVDMDRELH